MFCLVSLIIFSILGIFSLAYRKMAKEALACLLRKFSFRPCRADFQVKIRSKIIGFLTKRNLGLASFVYQRYQLLVSLFSFLILASFVVSGYFSVKSLYNLAIYDSCTPESPENCPFGKGEVCLFLDEAVMKELDLPAPADELTASVYQRLPTIVQRRIVLSATQKLSQGEQIEFDKLLKNGDGEEIQKFLSVRIPDFKNVIKDEFQKLREETLETLNLEK